MTFLHKKSALLASIFALSCGVGTQLVQQPVMAEQVNNSISEAENQTLIVVDPVMGNDNAQVGSPFKTISKALSIAKPGMTVRLKSGNYSSASGETFPLVVPSGVTLMGSDSSQGQETVIVGGSNFASSWWGRQNATILAKGSSSIKGLTVSNPEVRGTGIWVESSSATITNCLLTNNLRDGIFVAGKSSPNIYSNKFINNSANGVTVSNHSAGVIANNHFENTGFGISVSEDAAPMIRDNRIQSNVDGIVISHRAKPEILSNFITNNDRDGVVIISQAAPMLGSSSKPGRNSIKGNGRHAINNASQNTFVSNSGNDIQESVIAENDVEPPANLPVLTSEIEGVENAKTLDKPSLADSLSGAKSVSIDGKKYISVEDMLRLMK